MAKNKKTSKKIDKGEKYKEQVENSKKIQKELYEKTGDQHVMTVPNDAVIDIKISGYFRRRFEEVFYYLLAPLSAQEIVVVMNRIGNNFKDVPQDQITATERSIEAMMTLMSELNHQAAEQKLVVATKDYINESVSDFLTEMSPSTITPVMDIIEKGKKEGIYDKPIFMSEKTDTTSEDLAQ